MSRFVTYEGNRRALTFQLRQREIKGGWDVSGATQIRLEVQRPDNTILTPIIVDDAHPDADWSTGLVVAVIDVTNVTAAIGSYSFSLTVDIAGEIITAAQGTIEVRDRAGYVVP